MVFTAAEFADIMPDATQIESCEPEMESSLHYTQLMLLVACLEWLWRDRNDFFVGANLTVYFSRQQLKNRDFRGPDLFLVQGCDRNPRRSWVVWEEDGKYPDLIIELLSDSTDRTDRNLKKTLYQDRFSTHEYFYFSPHTLEFEGFRLINKCYEPIALNDKQQRWSEELDLFLGIQDCKLRYFHPNGELVLSPQEDADRLARSLQQTQRNLDQVQEWSQSQVQQAQARETQAQAREAQAQLQADRLREQLQALGIAPDL